MLTIETDFEISCAKCGKNLENWTSIDYRFKQIPVIRVEFGCDCYERIKQAGYDEGYNNGYEDGLKTGG